MDLKLYAYGCVATKQWQWYTHLFYIHV